MTTKKPALYYAIATGAGQTMFWTGARWALAPSPHILPFRSRKGAETYIRANMGDKAPSGFQTLLPLVLPYRNA